MKKLLLNLFTFLCFATSPGLFAQQNRSVTVSTLPNSSFNQAAVNPKGSNAVITTTTSTCMSINLPVPPTWSLVNYGTGTPYAANGFVNGPNTFGDKEKAMYFDVSASANTMITQVYVGFGKAYTSTPTKTVAVKFYDGTSGTPGTALGSGTLSMSAIMSDVAANRYSLIIFGTPINLPASKKFFASVDVTGLQWTAGVKDSLSIVSNTHPQSTPSPAWEKWSTNAWVNLGSASSWSLNISLLIHPFLTQAPIVSSITVSSNTVCTGQSVTYNSAGSTAGTYNWFFGAATTPSATGSTAAATYTSTGTYTTSMILTDACGSFGVASKTILVIPSPTVFATPSSTTICNGQSVTLSGSGASTYAWTGSISDATPFTPSTTLNYTVTGTAANGCTNSAVSSVSVNANPTVTANASATTVCDGNSVVLSGGGASTYVWSGGVTNAVSFVPTGTHSYTVVGTAANSCTASAVISISVNPNPTVTANTSTNTVCDGSSVILLGGGASTYSWSGGVTDAVAFVPTSTNSYTVIGTAGNSCTASAVVSVSVNPNPTVTASPSSIAVCNGDSVILSGGGATTYSWTGGVTNATSFTPTISANYTVTGYDANGCSSTAIASVNVNSNPSVIANSTSSMICVGSSVTLSGSGATTYTWSGGVTDGVSFTPTATASYTVVGTDSNGCTNTDSTTIIVSTCTGINGVTQAQPRFDIYPNPNNGEFTILLNGFTNSLSLKIYNYIGEAVYSGELTSEKTIISNNFASGIYIVNIIEHGKVISTRKLICN